MDEAEKLELHERVMALKELLEQGKVIVAEHLWDNLKASLEKIRYGDDGLVDPDTVDGRVRALSSVVIYDRRREQAKKAITQREIQELYFQQIEYYFGPIQEALFQDKGDPGDFADWFVEQEGLKIAAIEAMTDFLDGVEAFWDAMHYSSWLHEEDAEKSKAIFGGAIFPEYGQNPVLQLGLYIDTVLLFDPFIKSLPLIRAQGIESSLSDLIRVGLQVLAYKPLALADVDPPIVVILPERFGLDESYQKYLGTSVEPNILYLAERIFDKSFVSQDELMEFLLDFNNAENLIKAAKKPEYILFQEGDERPLESQLLEYMQQLPYEEAKHPGRAIHCHLLSRMMQAGDLINRSMGFRGAPIIQSRTSWKFFNWKLEMDAETVEDLDKEKMHITRGLGDVTSGELAWIGNIPVGSLIELRKQGATEELKAIIAKDISELIDANANDFTLTSKKVMDNLQAAFAEHEARLKALQEKQFNFYGYEVGGLLLRGTVAFTAAHLNPALPIITGMIGLPSIKDVAKKFVGLNQEKEMIDRSPIGMLVRAKR